MTNGLPDEVPGRRHRRRRRNESTNQEQESAIENRVQVARAAYVNRRRMSNRRQTEPNVSSDPSFQTDPSFQADPVIPVGPHSRRASGCYFGSFLATAVELGAFVYEAALHDAEVTGRRTEVRVACAGFELRVENRTVVLSPPPMIAVAATMRLSPGF